MDNTGGMSYWHIPAACARGAEALVQHCAHVTLPAIRATGTNSAATATNSVTVATATTVITAVATVIAGIITAIVAFVTMS